MVRSSRASTSSTPPAWAFRPGVASGAWPRAPARRMLRLVRRTLATLLLACSITSLGLLTATQAAACSCATQTTQQYFERADAVFTASLVSREEPRGQVVSSADPAVHVFAVQTVFKGTALESQEVLSPVSGATCGLELSGTGPFVVFASRSMDLGGTPSTALAEHQYASLLCDGTGPVTPELEAELAALAPSGPRSFAPGVELRDENDARPVDAWPLLAVLGAVAVLGGGALLARRSTGRGAPPPPASGPGSEARRDG